MGLFRAVGTLVAAGAGAGAGVGAALAVGDPFAAGAAAAAASLVVGYAVGHRGWITFAAALAYAAVGTAVLAGVSGVAPAVLGDLTELSMIPLQVGGALVGVGGAVAVLFLLRWSTGNLKRLSTRPVDAGAVRGAVASVASTVKSGRSLVRRLAGARLGPLPVGALAVLALWGGVVGGAAALGVLLSQGALGVDEAVSLPFATDRSAAAVLAPVTLVPYLAGLLVPAYVATDWFALDGIEDAPETCGVLARAAGRTPSPLGSDTTTTSSGSTGDAEGAETSADDTGPDAGTPPASAAPDATVTAAQESSEGPSASTAPDTGADSSTARIADTDGGARPGATADVLDPKDGDTEHWPNAEDNPWVDQRRNDGQTGDDPGHEETDEETPPALAPDDTDEATADPADDTDETTGDEGLSGDDRVTFGEPSGDGASDEPESESESDEKTVDDATPGPEPDEEETVDDATPGPEPEPTAPDAADGEPAADPDHADTDGAASDEAATPESGPSTWTTPPEDDSTDESSPSADPTNWAPPPAPEESEEPTRPEGPEDAGDTSDGSSVPGTDDTDDGPSTEVLDVDLPDITSVRERHSTDDPDTAPDDGGDASTARHDADDTSEPGLDTDDPSDTPTVDTGDDGDDGEGTADQIADRVSRILDGDLDAGEVDADDVDLDASEVDAESILNAGGSDGTDATADTESEESD